MASPLTDRMAQALRAKRPLALLAEIEHPSGTGRFWTGVGKLAWGGYEWTGSGTLGTITPIKHTSDIAIQEITFSMSGVASDVVAGLSDDVRNRAGNVWLACIGKQGRVVPDPYLILQSQLDYQSLNATDAGAVTISITARSGFYSLERALDESWSTEEQHLLYPDDSGFDMISGLTNQTLNWTPT
jgi:hypothetical protein